MGKSRVVFWSLIGAFSSVSVTASSFLDNFVIWLTKSSKAILKGHLATLSSNYELVGKLVFAMSEQTVDRLLFRHAYMALT